jgi:acyl-CoA thioesterase FadM
MSTKKYASVQRIFEELISVWNLKGYTALASHIGVPYQTLMAWKKRKSIGDYAPFMDKGISKEWLETGEGEMFRQGGRAKEQLVQKSVVRESEATFQRRINGGTTMVVTEIKRQVSEEGWEMLDYFESLCEEQKKSLLIVARTMAAGVPEKSQCSAPKEKESPERS